MIQEYLETLECCKAEANRKLNVATSAFGSAQAIYLDKKAYKDKLKTYWDKLNATNDKGREAKQAVTVSIDVASKLKACLSLDRDAIECLAKEVIAFSKELEMYCTCVDQLLKEIEKIKKAKFSQDNPIVQALKGVKIAYEEAIKAATASVAQMLLLLECAYILKFKMDGTTTLLAKCQPPSDVVDPCSEVSYDSGPDLKCLQDESPSDPRSLDFFKGLCKTLEQLKVDLCQQFELFTVVNGQNVYKCEYTKTIKEELDKMESEVEEAKCCMELIDAEKSKAKSRKEAADKAFEAADKAKKC